jgi:hypothetical protein
MGVLIARAATARAEERGPERTGNVSRAADHSPEHVTRDPSRARALRLRDPSTPAARARGRAPERTSP